MLEALLPPYPVIVGQIAMFVAVLLGLVHAAAGMVWVERKEAARMQQRVARRPPRLRSPEAHL